MFDLRGEQSVFNEHLGIRIVAQHVDLLPFQLANHSLDTDPFETNTGAHGIDIISVRVHSQLGAISRLPYEFVDLDRPVVELGHFQLEGSFHKIPMGSG